MKTTILMIALLLGSLAAQAQFYGVKVNGLALMSGTLNAGVEVSTGKQWSLEISGYWNPIRTDKLSMKVWWVQPSARYWLYEHFVGHFAAAHVAGGSYRIGNDRWYNRGRIAGVGVSYGYTWILAKRLNLTAELGPGIYYIRNRHQRYEYDDWEPLCITHSRRIVLAPSKLELSVTYLF